MSINADVLASTLQDLLPGHVDLYTKNHPLWDRIRKGGGFNRRKLKGPYMEFNVLTGGPGKLYSDRTGTTVLAATRKQNLRTGNEYGARLVYAFTVPEKDLEEADTPYDFANLVENYGEAGMAEIMEIMANQAARGSSSAGSDSEGGAAAFITLNGDQFYNPTAVGTQRSGVFQFAAPASQTATVHGVPMQAAATNPTTGWYHQYGNISSFLINGRKIMRTTVDTANQQGASLQGGVDLLMGDDSSYQNYAENLDDQVIAQVVENDKGQGKVREGLKFRTAVFFPDPAIDITDTTAFTTSAAQNGVIYALCTDDWEMFTIGNKNGGKDLFTVSPAQLIPGLTAFEYRISFYANMFCKNLRRQGAITGGAIA